MIPRPDLDVLEELCAEGGFRYAADEFGVGEWQVIAWLREYGEEEEAAMYRPASGPHDHATRVRYDRAEALARSQHPEVGRWVTIHDLAARLGIGPRQTQRRARAAEGVRSVSTSGVTLIAADDIEKIR